MALQHLLTRSAHRFPDRIAVAEADDARLDYAELDRLSDRVRDHLHAAGVRPGDRVGFCLHKSIDSIATLFGVLKAGAAYVPVDPTAPASRNGYIFANCAVRALFTEATMSESLGAELESLGHDTELFVLPSVGGGAGLDAALAGRGEVAAVPTVNSDPDDLAYILYTSGSTGRPKGVMISHRNAECFVDWCSQVLEPVATDRFSSHAPLHFDLSILDVYTPLAHGATLVLVGESLGKDPVRLAAFIADRQLTVWYSTPSILSLLSEYGNLASLHFESLRLVIFAGEVFPIAHLRRLHALLPRPRYLNLYGPTETNVCTWYELPPEIEPDRTDPYPIGIVCSHYAGRVARDDGSPVQAGDEGELLIAGPGVMQGYWGLDEQTAHAFTRVDGERWYRTGDLVAELPDGNLEFHGRKDRMVKKRGYRVELGEIESCLYEHPGVREVAVVAVSASDGIAIRAHLATRDGGKLSLIQLKQFCAARLPVYMVPDGFRFHDSLPKTSTDKIDYQTLIAGD